MRNEKWPNLFIVGAPKAGTTSFYEYLKKIPGIYMSPIKEPDYFDIQTIRTHHKLHQTRDKKKYLSLFKKVRDEKIIGEASPSYLSDPQAAKLIHQVSPDARIIISLRNPVERAFSEYLMLINLGRLTSTFHDQLQIGMREKPDANQTHLRLESGLYADDVKRYLDIFGRKNVKILIFENFIKEIKKTIEDILLFLGIDHSLKDFNEGQAANPYAVSRGSIAGKIRTSRLAEFLAVKMMTSTTRRFVRDNFILKKNQQKPKMEDADRNMLVNFYWDDVKKLEEILGLKLPWPDFN